MKIGMGWKTVFPLLLFAVCTPSSNQLPKNEESGGQQENRV